MDLNDVAINPERREQGAWVDKIPQMGDLALNVRGLGNKAFMQLQSELIAALPIGLKVGGRIDPAAADQIQIQCIVETILLDWRGLSQGGVPVEYSRETATRLLGDPALGRFRDAVIWAADTVAENRRASTGETAKN